MIKYIKGDGVFMIIDGHAHACGRYNCGENIIKHLDLHGIDKVVLCPGEPGSTKNYSYPMLSDIFKSVNLVYSLNKIICFATKMSGVSNHIDEQNKLVYDISREYPQRIVNAYWADPLDENCLQKLNEYYPVYNFKLIKMHQCWNKFDICDPRSVEIIKWAAEKNIPIFIHLLSEEQVLRFVKITNILKSCKFIVAHMIGFEKISMNTQNDNVYYDLSGPQTYPTKIIEKALASVGSKRLILGSDTPYGIDNIEKIQNRLKQQSLSHKDLDNIEWRNIAKLLGL